MMVAYWRATLSSVNSYLLSETALYGILWNLIGSKISTSSTTFLFFGPIGTKMAVPTSDWLRHFGLLLWNRRTEFNKTLQEARYQRPLPSSCFSDRSEHKLPPRSLISWDILDLFSATTHLNSTKLDRNQQLNILYKVCVFRADRIAKKAALDSDLLRHCRFLLCNRWMEFKETWQEARTQRPLPSLCFSGRSENQDGRPGLRLAEIFLLCNRWTEFNNTW